MENYYVRTVKLPGSVRGVTIPNDDGTFNVFINSSLSPECSNDTLNHELNHIKKDHFYEDTKSIEVVETEADDSI
ncbi:MAG: hypothetical protein IJZ54_07030 [Clostridia bacterium]|nr:hypothetical protein [Clostridia bacterium]